MIFATLLIATAGCGGGSASPESATKRVESCLAKTAISVDHGGAGAADDDPAAVKIVARFDGTPLLIMMVYSSTKVAKAHYQQFNTDDFPHGQVGQFLWVLTSFTGEDPGGSLDLAKKCASA